MPIIKLLYNNTDTTPAEQAGCRFGDKGTHTSRTMMLDELMQVMWATSPDSRRQDYAAAIIEENCLGKPTASTRRLTNQRLGELYGLDPSIPIFRIFRRLWEKNEKGRPLLALLSAFARDPFRVPAAAAVIQLHPGVKFLREPMRAGVRAA